MPAGPSYSGLAVLYDHLSQEYDYGQWVDTVLTLYAQFHRYNAPAVRVLDLGCGTGRAMSEFLNRGFSVTGVDVSGEMLAVAAEKLAAVGPLPLLLCQDIRDLNVGASHYDLAVALCDTCNYILTPTELTTAFAKVWQALVPGGVFILDINSAYKLTTVYSNERYIDEGPGFFIVWDNQWKPRKRICEMRLDVFTSTPSGLWRRVTEVHRQKAHTPAEVLTALEVSGFTDTMGPLAAFDLSEPTPQTERVFYAALRPKL